jgi:flagellar motor switch protein FliG
MEIFYTYSEDEVSLLGETFHAVEGYSEYEMEDLAAYYENIFKDKEDFKPGKSQYPYTMNAKADNVEISVQLILPPPDVDKSIKTQVSLMITILTIS